MTIKSAIKKAPSARALPGFTLIELLIAIAIGALVLTSAYASFSFGIKTRHRLIETSREMQEMRYFFDQLSEELRSSISFHPSSFSGDHHSVRFRGFLPSELVTLAYAKKSGNFSKQLKRFSTIMEIEYTVSEKAESVNVIKIVSNLRGEVVEQRTFDLGIGGLKFFYQAQGEENPDWQDAWGGRQDFPLVVKIEYDPRDTSGASEKMSHQRIVVLPARIAKEKQES